MNIVVPLIQVPDLVEELEFNADGTDVDRDAVKLQLSEWDDQALEEALCLKEASGATVIAVTPEGAEADSLLFTALAKGADRAVKLTGELPSSFGHAALAAAFADASKKLDAHLVLAGVQSVEDVDGQVSTLLSTKLGLPHASVVVGVELEGMSAIVKQEYSGGVMAELAIALPAVLGIQAARQAPRYAPVSKVRQIQKTAKLEELAIAGSPAPSGLKIRRAFKPEAAGRAEILEGEPADVAARLVEILKERGLAL